MSTGGAETLGAAIGHRGCVPWLIGPSCAETLIASAGGDLLLSSSEIWGPRVARRVA